MLGKHLCFETTKNLYSNYIFGQGEQHAAIQATAPLTDNHLSVTGACEEKLYLDLLAVNCSIRSHFKEAKLPRQDLCGVAYLRNRGTARTLQSPRKMCLRAGMPCRFSFDCK